MRVAIAWGVVAASLINLIGAAAGSNDSRPVTGHTDRTCKSKTVNYITHSLPQQCLRTNWPTPITSQHGSSPEAAATTLVVTSTEFAETSTATESPETNGPTPSGPASSSIDGAQPFMSFEDWKELMLRKAGQDPNDLKNRRPTDPKHDADASVEPANEAYGEEGEISLDFESYSERLNNLGAPVHPPVDETAVEEVQPAALDEYVKSKDAGKTCKERFSYSSFDAGATVLKTSSGAKNAKAILVENKDSYMLLECASRNKYVIVELSDDILVDTIVLANFEFFSSMVRHFRVSVSDRYPVKMDKWKDLGTFEAKNSRDIQAFLVENPLIWAKYVRIEFLTHYGKEYYCPVSLLRVHGTRMLESWKDSEAIRDDDEEEEPPELPGLPDRRQALDGPEFPSPSPNSSPDDSPRVSHATHADQCWALGSLYLFQSPDAATCPVRVVTTIATEPIVASLSAEMDSTADATFVGMEEPTIIASASAEPPVLDIPPPIPSPSYTANASSHVPVETPPEPLSTISAASPIARITVSDDASSATSPTPVRQSSTSTTISRNKTNASAPVASSSPTIQESFFKTVTKRLQLLEANITLSLKYMEDQSKHLQEAFYKIEKRQLAKVDSFLDGLNGTVFAELRSIRQQYDQVWQSTVIALESQKEQSERELIALSSRLNVLADEVVFQKRMSILQSVLLLSCLALVIFSRGLVTPVIATSMSKTVQFPNVPLSQPLYGVSPQSEVEDTASSYSAPTYPEHTASDSGPRRPHLGGASSWRSQSSNLPVDIATGDLRDRASRHLRQEASVSGRLSPPPSPYDLDDQSLQQHSRPQPQRVLSSAALIESRKPLPALPEMPD